MLPVVVGGNTKIRVKPSVIYTKLNKEAVLFNLENHFLYRLNQANTALWTCIRGEGRIIDIVSQVTKKCEELKSTHVKRNVLRQIKKFIREGLIEIVE